MSHVIEEAAALAACSRWANVCIPYGLIFTQEGWMSSQAERRVTDRNVQMEVTE